jgi:hypothetical protein
MKWIVYIIGGLLVLTGIIWFFQGIGLLPGSFMTGQTQWAFAGFGSAAIGLGLIQYTRSRSG